MEFMNAKATARFAGGRGMDEDAHDSVVAIVEA